MQTGEEFHIFQDRNDTQDAVVSGGAIVNLTGVIYIPNPNSRLTFSGGSSSGAGTKYTIFIVSQLILGGSGLYAGTDYSGLAGGSPIKKATLGE